MNSATQTADQPTTFFNIRTSALLEMVIFFVVAILADLVFFTGDRFMGVHPHPFWILVVFVSAQYGTKEGLVAAALSALVLLVGNIPPQPEEQYFWSYVFDVGIRPIMWLVAAVAIGELRNRHIRERNRLVQEASQASDREETIAQNYKKLKTIKENLELRVASEFRSALAAYEAAKSVDSLSPTEVLQAVDNLVMAVLDPKKFSVYMLNKDQLDVSTKFGWDANDHYRGQYGSSSDLFREVVGKRRVLAIVNADDEVTLSGEGVLAGPLMNPKTREVIGMLKIEETGFNNLNLTTVESFKVLCEWIGTAYINADIYQQTSRQSMVNLENNMLSHSFFNRQVDYVGALAQRANFDASLIVVKIVGAEKLPDDTRREAARELSTAVETALRKVDQAFDYHPSEAEYSVILPLTSEANAKIVVDKIMKALSKVMKDELKKVQLSFSVKALHKATSPKNDNTKGKAKSASKKK